MTNYMSLSAAEQAQQLAKPDGAIGVEVGIRLNKLNCAVTEHVYDRLELAAGMNILEIGFGNGRLLPQLLERAPNLGYVGIDISQTMVDEAVAYNASAVAKKHVTFHLASAESLPSNSASFDRVFAVNVIYFWPEPQQALREILRVLRPGGFSVIAAATPDTAAASPALRAEYGFHAHDEAKLVSLHKEVGFSRVKVETYNEVVQKPDGTPWSRSYYLVTGHGQN